MEGFDVRLETMDGVLDGTEFDDGIVLSLFVSDPVRNALISLPVPPKYGVA